MRWTFTILQEPGEDLDALWAAATAGITVPLQGAKMALDALLPGIGDGPYAVEVTGVANPDHETPAGASPDYVHLAVSRRY